MFHRQTGPQGPDFIGEKGRLRAPRLPGHIVRLLLLLVVVCAVLAVMFSTMFVYVHPNEYGIKEVKIGVRRGIQPEVYSAGLYFLMPFGFAKMHRFPRNVQVLELTAYPDKENPSHHNEKAAKIQTSDGFYVDVDVTILYRIHDPFPVITQLGTGQLYRTNGILPKAEPFLKQTLGELTTEDFYNSPLRVEKVGAARDLLNTELLPKGLEVDSVLVRYFSYSDEIQRNIEEKKLQDQLVFKNQAEAKAAVESASLKRVTQEGEMQVRVTLEEGKAYKVKKDADRELYARKKTAEADLLVQLAEARRTELKNTAMQAAGADRLVAQRMAEVLEGLETIIVPTGGPAGVNPLDLDGMLGLFGVSNTEPSAAGGAPAPLPQPSVSGGPPAASGGPPPALQAPDAAINPEEATR